MTVAPVRGHDEIVDGQMFADSDGHRFLSTVKMGEPGNGTGHDFDVEAFLKFADDLHLAVCAQQRLAAQLHDISSLTFIPYNPSTVLAMIGRIDSPNLSHSPILYQSLSRILRGYVTPQNDRVSRLAFG